MYYTVYKYIDTVVKTFYYPEKQSLVYETKYAKIRNKTTFDNPRAESQQYMRHAITTHSIAQTGVFFFLLSLVVSDLSPAAGKHFGRARKEAIWLQWYAKLKTSGSHLVSLL